ncbi:glycosyltransferase [Sphaerospermopsis sp. FACHB-1094]|uniref:glycosyltransferase n=1 Tax=Sphaerospermopsis sp. FACHB-1094 TaxID=2692861 RepID=UPI00168538E2|nr:glycosyltransferase [Sphaerospermopsis sp. FACHB-1094]
MNKPLFSIVIPTRERHQTLFYSIQSVLEQSYSNFELIIMDNCSSEETYNAVHHFNDSRIKYFRSDTRLWIWDNWELGISKANGDYIFVLGDDDGLVPDGIEYAYKLLQEFSCDIVSWHRPQYWWPNEEITWNSQRLFIHFLPILGQTFLHDSQTILEQFYENLYFENLPMIYNSFVSRKIIEKIKEISSGKYITRSTPAGDVYSGIVNAHIVPKYIYTYRPISIAGISPKSSGTSTAYLSKHSQVRSFTFKEGGFEENKSFHPSLIPSQSIEICVATTAIDVHELFFPENNKFKLKIHNLLQVMASQINRDPSSYEQVFREIESLAKKHNISLTELNIPPRMQEDPPSLQGIYKNEQGIPNFMVINCEEIGVSNVAQAAKLTQSLLPKLDQLILPVFNSHLKQSLKLSSDLKNNRKIKIALDISVLGLGTILETAKTGVFRVTEYLLKGLLKSSNCQVYLCTSIPELFDACQNYINENLSDGNIYLFQLSDLQYQDIDVYHSTYYPLPSNIYSATRIITVYDLIPIIFPNHNSEHIIKNTIDSIGRNDLVCCISKSTKQDISNYRTNINQEQLFVTYLAADNNKFYPCNNQKLIIKSKEKYNIPDQLYLLSLSTLEPRKNIAHVIRCFLKLIKEQHINDLNLVLVGAKGWQYEEIFAEIDRNQELLNRIIVTGYVPDEHLAPLYSGALAFLYVSLYEGFGLPPLEAMQCGTPVITSNTSSLPEVVGDAGVMLDPHDEKGLCDAIFKLYSDPEYRENLARKSVQQAQKFSWDKYIEETIKIYELAKETSKNLPLRNILIDGVFFQLLKRGIARVWRSLLQEWANTEFANHILVLDRANTAPKINGIRYRTIPPYDYNNTAADKQMLQQICNEEGADLFISSYYTTPITTPSVFMAYDMIPEVMGTDLNDPVWREKHHAIKHASAYIAISQNTARDLSKYFPNIAVQSITVAHCGVSNAFTPANPLQINTFKHRYGINKPYFLLTDNLADYKNPILFLKAFSKLPNSYEFDIIFTGFGGVFPPELRDYTSGSAVHQLRLSDEELAIAYSGAVALVYPSKYEGFGMPIVEAMACGCPVITCHNSSMPEVAGEAAIYVKENDVDAMANALTSVQNHNLRTSLITAGLAQAQKFSWTKMADKVSSALINATLLSLKLRDINLIIFPDPTQSEQSIYQDLINVITALEDHPHSDNITLLINASNFPSQFTQAFMDNLCNQDEEETAGLEISLVGKLSPMQWESLLPQLTARIVLTQEDQQTLEQLPINQLQSCEVESLNYQLSILLTESLKQNLRLRDINLIIFPEPTQSEQSIYQDLINVITALEEHPDSDNITLLINASNFPSQFTQAFMDNLCNQDEEETAGLEISLVGKLSPMQWESLLPQLSARIVLNNEDQQALEQVQLENLTSYQLDNLDNQQF